MHMVDAFNLQKKWGDKNCNHPSIDELFYLGKQEDFVCEKCGKEISSNEKEKIINLRN